MTVDLPPPSGAPQPPPQPTAAAEADTVPAPLMPPPYAAAPPHPAHPDFPGQPGQPGQSGQPSQPGQLDQFGQPGQYGQPGPSGLPFAPAGPPRRNGVAIAALCCGIAGFIPVVGVIAIVLGVIALHQLRAGFQRGRGMAITGIVLGALTTLAWTALIVIAIATGVTAEPERSSSGQVSGQSQVFIDKLKAGDCFSGGKKDQIDLVTAIPCTSPHESQVVAIIQLPDGPYPGEDAVTSEAEQGCTDKADPLITDRAYDELDPSYVYPDADTWRGDRSVLCLVEAPSGTTTGSALK
ncbi:DUF4190 domain-containing protein [Humibacillus xanthopallidus]|uniref:DUF4190 domain-containing protein n=1 Tax=Humibacillus xanthopallidus TaxID=412689 RepID=UPI0011523CC3|nr:DUF4190 domain-containing protein [Humibacillus xanthopallidus]